MLLHPRVATVEEPATTVKHGYLRLFNNLWNKICITPTLKTHNGNNIWINSWQEATCNLMITLEKILILKSVDLFKETSDELLADIVNALHVRMASRGETIIHSGEPGNSMFIIVEGKVRVHQGKQTLATLGPHDVFGELSALDPEPRVASVSASEDVLLFVINREELYEIMSLNVGITRGIVKVLCNRIRTITKQLTVIS